MGSERKKVVLLGATGSIGESTLRVLRTLPELFELYGVVARNSVERLRAQALEFGAKYAIATGDDGMDEVVELVTRPEVDIVLCAIVGTGGLAPTLAALRAGKRVALASKEVLVMAGELVRRELAASHGELLPVDSEHSAIFQCLHGRSRSEVAHLVLTASGGAFRNWPLEKLSGATVAEALKHPTWSMGPKVTIDSATLMNKALELVEARYLFDAAPEQLKVVIHPESVVHSMIEFVDGSFVAQLSRPDMRFAIQYALTYPARASGALPKLDFGAGMKLNFYAPEPGRYPALAIADAALRAGGTLPAVMNAANEVAVESFRRGGIGYPHICGVVEHVMERHSVVPQSSLDTVVEADAWARRAAVEAIKVRS